MLVDLVTTLILTYTSSTVAQLSIILVVHKHILVSKMLTIATLSKRSSSSSPPRPLPPPHLPAPDHLFRIPCCNRTWGICTRRAGKLYRARSRLDRSQMLSVNMRLKALAEIYTMHFFAPFSSLKIFVQNCWIFADFWQILRKIARILLNFC